MNTKDIVYIALFSAFTAALGLFPPITLPAIGVPITAQTMGVMLAGALAGSKRGGLALLLFLALVAIGMPVLAGGRGGFSVFLGPTCGFLLSWPIAAFLIGWLLERSNGEASLPVSMICIATGGVGVVYLFGIPWLSFAADLTIAQAAAGSAGFIPGDLVKVVLAALIARGVRRAIPDLAAVR